MPAKPSHTERINPFPTAIDLSSGKTDTYCNKVAPTARIYLHLICRKRHLPLKLRKGKTIGCGAKFSNALMFGEAATVLHAVPNRATAKLSNALLGCVADTVSTNVPNRATRDKCIRRCGNSPLKNIELWRYCGIINYYNLPLPCRGSRKVNGGFEHG